MCFLQSQSNLVSYIKICRCKWNYTKYSRGIKNATGLIRNDCERLDEERTERLPKKKKLKAAKTAKHLKKQQAKNPIKLLTTYKKNADINKQETNWLISNEGKL